VQSLIIQFRIFFFSYIPTIGTIAIFLHSKKHFSASELSSVNIITVGTNAKYRQ